MNGRHRSSTAGSLSTTSLTSRALLPLGSSAWSRMTRWAQRTFKPPYKMVMGNAFIFQDDLVAPTRAQDLASPPITNLRPASSRGPTSVDSWMETRPIRNSDGTAGWDIGRRPFVWPSDVSDVSAYYMEIDAWRAESAPPIQPISAMTTHGDGAGCAPDGELPRGASSLTFRRRAAPEKGHRLHPCSASSLRCRPQLILPTSPLGARLTWTGHATTGMVSKSAKDTLVEINMYAAEQEANAERMRR